MGSVCYFDGIIVQYPPPLDGVDPSQWEAMRLKGETSDYAINKSWTCYLQECVNLICLRLDDASDMKLYIKILKRLEGFSL
jgi:hypothetical protein